MRFAAALASTSTLARFAIAQNMQTMRLGLAMAIFSVGLSAAGAAQPEGKTAFLLFTQCGNQEASCYAYLSGVYDTMLAVLAAGAAMKDIICPPKDTVTPSVLADKYRLWTVAYPSLLGIPMSQAAYLAILDAYRCPGP